MKFIMRNTFFLNILFMTLVLTSTACSKSKQEKQSIQFRISALETNLQFNGGSFVNAISGANSSLIKLDVAQSAILPAGIYDFQSVSFEGASAFLGKKHCGTIKGVSLSQTDQNISMSMSEENCLVEPFISLISKIYDQNDIGVMITKWQTNTPGAVDPNQIALPLVIDGEYNFEVDWGDGEIDIITTWDDIDRVHNYSTAGTYIVKMTGRYDKINFNGNATHEKILDVTQWGINKWISMDSAFKSCSRLQITAKDKPNLSNVKNMRLMFANATSFNSDISFWNTSSVTDMSSMFQGASAFNQSVKEWDTSKVVDMNFMFSRATNFNQSLSLWNTSSVKNMSGMFSFATNFNQSIGEWNTSAVMDMDSMFSEATKFNQNIGSWNTSLVTTMSSMFHMANAFNQNIGQWNTASVINMSDMFSNATSFNADIGRWDTHKVRNMSGMFKSAGAFNQNIGLWNVLEVSNISSMFLDTLNFNQDLSSWNIKNTTNISSYDTGATAWLPLNKPTFLL